jgi:receptor protein-tyrosine kinase
VTAADLIKLEQVAQKVKDELDSPRSIDSLRGMVTVRPNSAADIIDIVVTSPKIDEPAELANSFARQFISYRQDTDRAVLAQARAQLTAEFAAMTQAEVTSPRGQTISQKVEELAVLESMQTGGFELVQEARTPLAPFNIHKYRNGAIGLVLGAVLGVMVASFRQVLDRRIKDEDGFEREYGAPVIASIPLVGHTWRGRRGRRSSAPIGFNAHGAATIEGYRTLRSNLKFFQVGRPLKNIVVTSSLPREGKSVTAVNLALSLAMSGSRVILLEADLRRPMLGEYLGLNGRMGFTDLLAGSARLDEVIQVVDTDRLLPGQELPVHPPSSSSQSLLRKDLLFVGAGPLPPNPAELLALERTNEVLRGLSAMSDYLVIDAPPVLLVSDAAELAKKVDGLIMVSRLQWTTTEEARRTRQTLERIGLKPLGVVVNGVRRARTYYQRYGLYYTRD